MTSFTTWVLDQKSDYSLKMQAELCICVYVDFYGERFKLSITILISFVSYAQVILSLPNINHSWTYPFIKIWGGGDREKGRKKKERR